MKTSVTTVLAPNAPWYTADQLTSGELVWPVKEVKQPYVPRKPEKRTHRAKPSNIDKKFEAWLSSIERIK